MGLKTEDLIAVEELAGEEPEDRKVRLTEIISRKGELERQVYILVEVVHFSDECTARNFYRSPS